MNVYFLKDINANRKKHLKQRNPSWFKFLLRPLFTENVRNFIHQKIKSKILIRTKIIFLYCPLLYQFMCQYSLSKTNPVAWRETAVGYVITMAQFVHEIKYPMVRRKFFKILSKKNPL